MKPSNIFYTVIFLCIIGFVFKNWFITSEIIGGDWPYYYQETLREFTFFPVTWNPEFNNGLGGVDFSYYLNTFQNFTVFFTQTFHIPWVIIYKIFWFGFFIALSIVSTITFLKITIPSAKYWQLLTGAIIFVSNTYILMVVGGGQMGVALAYSVAPLVLGKFIKLIHYFYSYGPKLKIKNEKLKILKSSFLAGIVLSLQVMFDPRIAYISIIVVFFYFLLSIRFNFLKHVLNTSYLILYTFFIPIVITILLHSSWILPLLLFRHNPLGDLGESYTGSGAVKFLSFAHFSDALALLHPNWPENLFGKSYFMRAEFLLLPLFAFSCLLFLKNIALKNADQNAEKRRILFFVFLSLIGVFLSKGASEPFGGIYVWLFEHVPGFVLFRDPTKFYLLIIVAYSVLIPLSLEQFSTWLGKRGIRYSNIIPVIFLMLWLILIRQAVFQQLGGTFAHRSIPKEYVQLKNYLHNKSEFYRTLWIPRRDRFSYYTNNHLAVESEPLYRTRNIGKIATLFTTSEGKDYLAQLGVQYIIVPQDPYGEVFVKDRKFDPVGRDQTVKLLESMPQLTRIPLFKRIAVFQIKNNKDRFFLEEVGVSSYRLRSPTEYVVHVSLDKPQNLIFSQSYNPSWEAKSNGRTVISKKTKFRLNSFVLDKTGSYDLTVSFTQDKYYTYGQIISVAALVGITILILYETTKQ